MFVLMRKLLMIFQIFNFLKLVDFDFEENECQPSQHDVDQRNESPRNWAERTRSLREIYEKK